MSTRNDARAQFEAWAKEQHLIGASGYSPSGKIAWQAATLCVPLCEQPDVSKQRDMLAEAIGDAAVKSGIYRSGMSFSGPQLLMACDDMANCILAAAKPVPEGMILVDKEDLTDVCLDLLNLVDVTQFSKTRAERDKSVAHKLLELLTNE